MIMNVPTKWYFATGVATGETELNAFDNSLCAAGIGNTNLVKMSSILPPHCEEVPPVQLPLGALVPVAYADMQSNNSGQNISAAVAIAFPVDPNLNGVIMEAHGIGNNEEYEALARAMAINSFEARGYELKEVRSCSVTTTVQKTPTSVFAGVVLWD